MMHFEWAGVDRLVTVQEAPLLTLGLLWWLVSLGNPLPCSAFRGLNRTSQPPLPEPMRSSLLLHFLFPHNPGWTWEAFLLFPSQVITEIRWETFCEMYTPLFIPSMQWKQQTNFLSNRSTKSESLPGKWSSFFPCNYSSRYKRQGGHARGPRQGDHREGDGVWWEQKQFWKITNYWTSENVPGIVNITNSNMLFLKEWISYGICPLLSGLFHLA